MKPIFAFLAVGSILALSWCCASLRTDPVETPGPGRGRAAPSAPDFLDALERNSARVPRGTRAGEPEENAAAEMEDEDLLAHLRATGRAFSEHDERALTAHLEALLGAPRTPRRVLALMANGRIALQSNEHVGAVVATGFAVARSAQGGILALAGKPFARDFLEALAHFERETGEPVAEFTASLIVRGRPAIGAMWIGDIVELRARNPEHAENFDPLLATIVAHVGDGEMFEGDLSALAIVLSTSSDPLAVQAALSVLVARDPQNYVPIAEELYAQSSRSSELAGAIVSAIAKCAPVDAAAASMVRLASSELYGQFTRLGERNGALDAVQHEYNALAASDQNPLARKMLVASMGGENEAALIGIAETDTDASVRGQALLTLTQRPIESESVMATLRAQHAASGGAAGGLTTQMSLMVAENVAIHGAPGPRSSAITWLREVATNPRESLTDRKSAFAKLRARAEPAEIAGIEAPR